MKYYAEIDGLRALSIILVIVFHIAPGTFGGGYIGVDIFFVISGFLITIVLLEDREISISKKLLYFYKRRIKRILPPLVFMIFITLLAGYFLLTKNEFYSLAKHSLYSGFFSNNILLANEIGYFDTEGIYKPFLHLWSLSIEEQFYLLFPFIIILLTKYFYKSIALCTILFLWMASFIFSFSDAFSDNGKYYNTGIRSFELLFGAILGFVKIYYPTTNKYFSNHPLISTVFVFLSIILISFVYFVKFEVEAPLQITMVLSVLFTGSGLLLFQSEHQVREGGIHKIFSHRLVVFVGLISFSLYLTHYPILSFLNIINPSTTPSSEIISVLISFIASSLMYKFVECKTRAFSVHKNKPYIIILISFASVTLFSLFTVNNIDSIKNDLPDKYSLNSNISDMFTWNSKNTICTNIYPSIYDKGEYNISGKLKKRNFCIQNKNGTPNILLLGSSFANHLYPGFESFANNNNLTVLSLGDCALDIDLSDKLEKCNGNFLKEENKNRKKAIVDGGDELKVVAISGFETLTAFEYEKSLSRLNSWLEFINRNATKAVIIVYYPHYTNGTYAHQCYTRPFRNITSDCTWKTETVDKFLHSIDFEKYKNNISKNFSNVYFINTNDLFCNEQGICSILDKNGLPLLRDRGHLSSYGSNLLFQKTMHRLSITF